MTSTSFKTLYRLEDLHKLSYALDLTFRGGRIVSILEDGAIIFYEFKPDQTGKLQKMEHIYVEGMEPANTEQNNKPWEGKPHQK